MHVWGYSGPPTRIITTVFIILYTSICPFISGEKKHGFFIFVVQAQAGETDVRAEVSMPAPVTAAEHTHKKTRQDKVGKPAFKKTALIAEKGGSTVRLRCTIDAVRQFRFLIWNPPSYEWFYLVASGPCWNTEYTVAVNKHLPAVRKARCRMRDDNSGCKSRLKLGARTFSWLSEEDNYLFLHWWKLHKPEQDDCFGTLLPVSISWLTSPLCSSERSHDGEADHRWGTLWLVTPQGPLFTHDAHTTDCCFSRWRLCSVCPDPAFPHSGPPEYAPPPTPGRSRSHLQPASPGPRAPPCPVRAPPKPCFSGGGSKVRPPTLTSHGASCWLRASCCSYFFSRSFGGSHSLPGTGYTQHPQTSFTGCQFWHA